MSSGQSSKLSESRYSTLLKEVQSSTVKVSELGLSRRSLLKLSGIAGGGFALASCWATADGLELEIDGEGSSQLSMNAFIEISALGAITIFSHTPEMGQGVKTAIPMIAAEELGANWDDVTVVQAPVNERRYGLQQAGGSRSCGREYDHMREMGAAARMMFIAAASEVMGLDESELKTAGSQVTHTASGRSVSFAELAANAALQKTPRRKSLVFKAKEDYQLLGKRVTGVDNIALVMGEPLFGVDQKVPGLLHAVYEKCPAYYGKAVSANIEHIKSLPGVVDAFIVNGNGEINGVLSGVAIVAKSTWQAFSAQKQLDVEWDESEASKDSWIDFSEQAKEISQVEPERKIADTGDVAKEFSNAKNKIVESLYEHPYVSHACLEPMNCTAHYTPAGNGKKESLEVWVPSQYPARIYGAAEKILGIPTSRTIIHQTRMGGAFGRRGRVDFSMEAATISKKIGAPVKLTWTREDDMQHDFYRAGGFHAMKGAVDEQGKLVAMKTHIIGPGFRGARMSGIGQSAQEFPALNLPNYESGLTLIDTKTPCGPWRAPGSNVTAWAIQSFIAEMAHAAGRDHLEFLIEIMGEPRWFDKTNERSLNTGRAVGVIKLAAEKAGWGKTLPKGRGLGLAFHFCHAGHVAEIVDLSVDDNKKITIHNVTVAVDIGPVLNRSGAENQVQGSVLDGFSTMYGLEITMEDGRVQQSNFHDYIPLRIQHTPTIDVHFIESDYPPTGIGEPALPPIAPAIANAVFAVSGYRIRSMPIKKEGFTV